MAILHFQKAVREGAPVLIALYGESGSGKTYSALKLARGLVGPQGRICVIDTERKRARVYANIGAPWDHAELTPPFSPERYIEALAEAEAAKYDAVVIDSASHEWDSIGGILEIADENPRLVGKGLVQWAKPKARHKKWVQALVRAGCHVILCLRAKEKMAQKKDEKGQDIIVSTGFVPIQDKRFIYEVTCQLFLPTNPDKRGVPIVEKAPEDLLGAFPAGEQISEKTGERIRQWLRGGAVVDDRYERVKREAEDRANEGTIALRDFWQDLPREDKLRLKPQMDNLKSIAAEADRRIAEEQLRGRDDEEPDRETGEIRPSRVLRDEQKLEDPFGDAPP